MNCGRGILGRYQRISEMLSRFGGAGLESLMRLFIGSIHFYGKITLVKYRGQFGLGEIRNIVAFT